MSVNGPGQDDKIPLENEPVYLGTVEDSDASYVVRIQKVIGECFGDCYRIQDHLGKEWLIRRFYSRDLGHQHAWIALGEVPVEK